MTSIRMRPPAAFQHRQIGLEAGRVSSGIEDGLQWSESTRGWLSSSRQFVLNQNNFSSLVEEKDRRRTVRWLSFHATDVSPLSPTTSDASAGHPDRITPRP